MPTFGSIQSYDELINLFPEESIYYKYLGHCTLNKHFCSVIPERIKEKGGVETTPSMMLKYKNNHILWKDFGLPDQKGSKVVHLVMYLLEHKLDYYATLQHIYDDMLSGDVIIPYVSKRIHEVTKQIKYKLKLQQCQIDYYNQYGISRETLKLFNVAYATELSFDGKLWHRSTETDFMNLFLFNEEEHVWHINRPFADIDTGTISQNKKHRPNNMEDVIMGYCHLPKRAEVMGITKSYKDIMLNYECGIPSVGKYGEWMILGEDIIAILKKRCKRLIYFGDNDSTGEKVKQIYREKYGIETWSPPDQKDQSDFVKKRNGDKTELIQLFNQLKQ